MRDYIRVYMTSYGVSLHWISVMDDQKPKIKIEKIEFLGTAYRFWVDGLYGGAAPTRKAAREGAEWPIEWRRLYGEKLVRHKEVEKGIRRKQSLC